MPKPTLPVPFTLWSLDVSQILSCFVQTWILGALARALWVTWHWALDPAAAQYPWTQLVSIRVAHYRHRGSRD